MARETPAAKAPAQRRAAKSRADKKPLPARPLTGALIRAGIRIGSWIPYPVCYWAGGLLGTLGSVLNTRWTRATRINLALCLPDLTDAERRRIARRSLQQSCRMALEIGGIWGWSKKRTLRLVREVCGEEHLNAALAKGKGVILIGPHLGTWELMGLWCATRHPTVSLYKPPRVREIEQAFIESRERFGAQLVPAEMRGVRTLREALERGEMAGILPDQDPGRGSGIFVPFFGTPANTSVLIPRLIQKTGAEALVAYCERLPRAQGYRVHIVPTSDAIRDPDMEIAATAMNEDIERCVRSLAEQYLWSYRRFRVQPEGLVSPYRAE